MILLATRMANESDMKTLLLTSLEALLQTLKRGENLEDDIEAITLIRCIIRLVSSLLDDPVSNQQVFDFQEPSLQPITSPPTLGVCSFLL